MHLIQTLTVSNEQTPSLDRINVDSIFIFRISVHRHCIYSRETHFHSIVFRFRILNKVPFIHCLSFVPLYHEIQPIQPTSRPISKSHWLQTVYLYTRLWRNYNSVNVKAIYILYIKHSVVSCYRNHYPIDFHLKATNLSNS